MGAGGQFKIMDNLNFNEVLIWQNFNIIVKLFFLGILWRHQNVLFLDGPSHS